MAFIKPITGEKASHVAPTVETSAIATVWFKQANGVWMAATESHPLADCCVQFPGVVEMLEALNMAMEDSPSRLQCIHVEHMVGRVVVYVTTKAMAGDLPLDLVDALDMDYVGHLPIVNGKHMLRFSRNVAGSGEIALSVVAAESVGLTTNVEDIWRKAFAGVGSPMTALKRFMTAGIRLA